ncbi:hypothetical protein OROGR_015186 [Orobanche gracilis]
MVEVDGSLQRQWVREEDLAKDLKLQTKQLRRTLRVLEIEKLVTRDHRKETSKGAKIYNAAVAANGEGQQTRREVDEKFKMHTHSYCCLDYAQIYDVARYRLHRMKKKLKDELESKNTVQEYICPNCSKRYTALDALRLISPYDEYFHCESCNGVLVAESDKLDGQEPGDGDDNVRRRRHDKIKDMLTKMEEQLKPLIDQLARVKDLPVPEFGNLQAWELRANTSTRSANGELNPNDPSKSSHGLGFGGTPMPYGETKVEVAFSGIGEQGENESANANTPAKILPPWMITQGMSITKEQWGEANKEMKGGTFRAPQLSDDKKFISTDNEAKNIQDEYIKAYYAAVLLRQREQEETVKKEQESTSAAISSEVYNTPTDRRVGMKSNWDDDDNEGDVQWEDAPPTGGRTERFVVDLNMEAVASEDDEDDVDWEEG